VSVTITEEVAAVAIRAAASGATLPASTQVALNVLFPAATSMVERYAPEAPDAIHDAAVVRLLGWMWDSEPAMATSRTGIVASGAAAVLSMWRVHRASAVEEPATLAPPDTPASNLPPTPESGTFILSAANGELEWLPFPLP